MEIIDGKLISNNLKLSLKEKINEKVNLGFRAPKLSVILVGEDPASLSYVKGKSKASFEVGIINDTIRLNENVSEEELLDLIDRLNEDETVDGILVQLPLPSHIDEAKVISRVSILKDVDGFHPLNVANLYLNKEGIIPCTPKGVMKMLEAKNINLDGLNAVVIGRSKIVGEPLRKLLQDKNATVTLIHSHTKNQQEICKRADLICVAMGHPRYLTKDYVKEGAILIDIGVNRDPLTNKLCGDIDFESCKDISSYITKVPGGVGPMTIACLMENTVELYLKHLKTIEKVK